MVDAFCNAINKSIKQEERAYIKEMSQLKEGEKYDEDKDFSLYNITYKELLDMVVCDSEKMECMVHCCDKCPTFTALETFLKSKLEEYEITDKIKFSHWDSTDRTTDGIHWKRTFFNFHFFIILEFIR